MPTELDATPLPPDDPTLTSIRPGDTNAVGHIEPPPGSRVGFYRKCECGSVNVHQWEIDGDTYYATDQNMPLCTLRYITADQAASIIAEHFRRSVDNRTR